MKKSEDPEKITSASQSAGTTEGEQRETSDNVKQGESLEEQGENTPKPEGIAPSEQRPIIKLFSMHDTPPPIEIGGGSLTIELDKDEDFIIDNSGTRRKHKRRNTPGKNAEIGHVKILDGSGETLYRNLNPERCEIDITLKDQDQGTHTVGIWGGTDFVIETGKDKKLTKIPPFGNPGTSFKKRKRKYDYDFEANSNSKEFVITKVKVEDDGETAFQIGNTANVSLGECRIMIWLHERSVG